MNTKLFSIATLALSLLTTSANAQSGQETNQLRVAWQYYDNHILRLDYPCTGTNTTPIYPNEYGVLTLGNTYVVQWTVDFKQWINGYVWYNTTVSNYHGIYLISTDSPYKFFRVLEISPWPSLSKTNNSSKTNSLTYISKAGKVKSEKPEVGNE